MEFSLILYCISLILQLTAAWMALSTAQYAGRYLTGWVFLSLAMLLMTGRRIAPMMNVISTGQYDLVDALLSVPISLLLLLGMVFVRRSLIRLQGEKDKLAEISRRDSLTGLYNHTEIIRQLGQEIGRGQRFHSSVALIMLDIDDFKKINDVYGHQTGDRVLEAIAKFLTSTLRHYDAAGRYGGEEFLLILPQTNSDDACEIAERLRQGLAEMQISVDQQPVQLTVSIGIAVLFNEAAVNDPRQEKFDYPIIANRLITLADKAMYQSKSSGKNKCTCLTQNWINLSRNEVL